MSSQSQPQSSEGLGLSDDMPKVPFDDDEDAPLDVKRITELIDEAERAPPVTPPGRSKDDKPKNPNVEQVTESTLSMLRRKSVEALSSLISPLTASKALPFHGEDVHTAPTTPADKGKGADLQLPLSPGNDSSLWIPTSELIGGFELKDDNADVEEEEGEAIQEEDVSIDSEEYSMLALRDRIVALEKIVKEQQKQITTLNIELKKEREATNREFTRMRNLLPGRSLFSAQSFIPAPPRPVQSSSFSQPASVQQPLFSTAPVPSKLTTIARGSAQPSPLSGKKKKAGIDLFAAATKSVHNATAKTTK